MRSNRYCVCSSYYFRYFLVLLSRRDGWAGARGDREPREEDCFDFHSRPTNPPPQAKACLAGDVRIRLLGRHPSACHCQSHSRFPTLDRPASPQALVSGSAAMTATSSSSPSRSVSAVPRQIDEEWRRSGRICDDGRGGRGPGMDLGNDSRSRLLLGAPPPLSPHSSFHALQQKQKLLKFFPPQDLGYE